jgi:RNA polymerase sigma-70 factor (TIGR02960 family)
VDRSEAAHRSLLVAAREGDSTAFERVVGAHRRELYVHCYRMLGGVQDAEDSLQEALLAAWRGIGGFQGRGSLRAWLYRIATNVCLRAISRRPRRILSPDYTPPRADTADLGEPVAGQVWLEPLLDDEPVDRSPDSDPAQRYARREGVEIAFVAALQHLPGTQRAVLILRDVLGYSAAEVAEILDTTPASVNSALQRARQAVKTRVPAISQQVELDALGTGGQAELVEAFVAAWEQADVEALIALLAEDATFVMPPLPAWYSGRRDVARFFAERVFQSPWRLVPREVNAQLGLQCYMADPESGRLRIGAVNALTVRTGQIAAITAFLDPELHRRLGIAPVFAEEHR